jgi:hypothetical protein
MGVQPGDYDVWKARFGATSGSGAAAATGVPEPTTLVFTLIAVVFSLTAASRRRHSRSEVYWPAFSLRCVA